MSPVLHLSVRAAPAPRFSVLVLTDASPSENVVKAMQSNGSIGVQAAGPCIEIGCHRIWVESRLGLPGQVLPDGSWVYQGFSVTDSDLEGGLVVKFTSGRVTSIRLYSQAALAALIPPNPAGD